MRSTAIALGTLFLVAAIPARAVDLDSSLKFLLKCLAPPVQADLTTHLATAAASVTVRDVGIAEEQARETLERLAKSLELSTRVAQSASGVVFSQESPFDEFMVRSRETAPAWLDSNSSRWALVAKDTRGGNMSAPSNPLSCALQLPSDLLAQQKMLGAWLDSPESNTDQFWSMRDMNAVWNINEDHLEMHAAMQRSAADAPLGEVTGKIGWRVPLKTVVFDFPLNAPTPIMSMAKFRAGISLVDSAGALLQLDESEAEANDPNNEFMRLREQSKIIGILPDGKEVPIYDKLPVEVSDINARSTEAKLDPSIPAYFVQFSAPFVRLRVEIPTGFLEYSTRIALKPSATLAATPSTGQPEVRNLGLAANN